MKGCILPFPKKGDLGLAKNYQSITLTSITAKTYNALLCNHIEPKIENKTASEEIDPRRHKYPLNSWGVLAKNLQATILFVDFTKSFDSI